MIDKYIIDKLRQLPIEKVADALGMGIRWHQALCPFHSDSHPSLHFSKTHNTYHCYVCGAHGGTIDLVMHRENLKFKEACLWLADAFGVYVGDDSRKFSDRSSRRLSQLYELANASQSLSASSSVNPSSEARSAVVDTEYLALYVAHPVLTPEAEHFLFEERKLKREVVEWCHVSSVS